MYAGPKPVLREPKSLHGVSSWLAGGSPGRAGRLALRASLYPRWHGLLPTTQLRARVIGNTVSVKINVIV